MRLNQKLWVVFMFAMLVLSACSPTVAVEEATVALTIITENGTTELTLDEVYALSSVEGYGGIKSSTGKITPPAMFKGIALRDMVTQFGDFDETKGVIVYAEDGYSITYSYSQIMNGDFIAYDPGTGEELKSDVELTAIVAYEIEGQTLDAQQDGNLRMAVISADNNQVVDGHWAVKWVNKIEIKALATEWNLHMEGITVEDIDRGTFESGATPHCHEVIWTDDKGQEWRGMPLWLLTGWVDDQIKHEGPAYNDELAEAGYSVDVIASDGYTVSFESSRVYRNDDIIVAFEVDGVPLPEKYFPLRLVGPGLESGEMVGMIAEIVLNINPDLAAQYAPTEEPGAELPPVTGDLVVIGLVESQLGLMDATLRLLPMVEQQIEHPKKGPTDYTGVTLNSLLDFARVKPEASTLLLTASDGYTSEVELVDVRACEDCMIAFTDTEGVYDLVMGGFDSGFWIKEIVSIEVK